MKTMMDAKDEFHLSFVGVVNKDDDGVMEAVVVGKTNGNGQTDEESPTKFTESDTLMLKSKQSITFSDGSSSLQLSDSGEGGQSAPVHVLVACLDEFGEEQGLQKDEEDEEDADDELSDDNSTAGGSASESASSQGITATSSGDSTYQDGRKAASGWDMPGTKGCCCCFRFGRFLAFWLLVAGTIVVGKKMVQYSSQRETELMEEEFYDLASELILTAQHRHETALNALKTMSLTALTVSTGQIWPFVVLPDFDLWTNRFSIGARAVTLVVLAEQAERDAWNEFSRTNSSSWVAAADIETIVPYVWKKKEDNISSSTMMESADREQIIEDGWIGNAAISWQSTTPVDPQAINFNQWSSQVLGPAIDRLYATKSPIQFSASDVPSSTFLFQPIVPIDEVELVGYLMAQISWTSYFEEGGINSDPISTPGLVLIVQDLCAGYAFELDLYHGRDARLVPPGRISELASNENAMMTEAPLFPTQSEDKDDIYASSIVIQVFADDTFEGLYGNAALRIEPPMLTLATAIFVILLGTICFLLYHFWTQRKQEELAQSAKRTLAIVNSLFPANVRDRLLEKEDTTNSLPHAARSSGGLRRASTGGKSGGKKKLGQPNKNNKIQNRFSTVFQSMAESMALARDSGEDDGSDSGTPPHVSKSFSNSLRKRIASKPIADLFPAVTVLFADIAGFTSWSSSREPSQVFTLLESIFEAFDGIAKRHKVFKVETIGDCYVAAAGLPEPRPDHAIAMARFSSECMGKMHAVVQSLEVLLGPGTSDLSMRFGMHSGPVTAGVLRGEKSRFQLFGDTVNTAARIESSGEKNRIHLSKQTADLLMASGKENWVRARDAPVTAKGKGQLQTYWLTVSHKSSSTVASPISQTIAPLEVGTRPLLAPDLLATTSSMRRRTDRLDSGEESSMYTSSTAIPKSSPSTRSDQMKRLVDYNTQVLEQYLKKMVAMRQEKNVYVSFSKEGDESPTLVPVGFSSAGSIFEEVQESISLPIEPAKYLQKPDRVLLSSLVTSQLRGFVGTIASMYKENNFHNFDHASHVVMSVTKLMARVVTPETIDYKDMSYKIKAGSSMLHQYTYGITSDPLTQFAVTLAALIHDVDHQGVPNVQLVEEEDEIAVTYSNKSVAEQHSIYLAWDLLMEDSFKELRNCIYTSQAELDRFRALLVNAVMATDIADKDLSARRRRRWEKVFGADEQVDIAEEDQESTNRKAVIVIEHLIQASDVAHTMQHWHVFLRWNKRLFKECYLAYQSGRGDKDPLESWYQGELGFFDFYIIPLAKKLKECGVFGVASDEYLQYAIANRTEWEEKGHEIVNEYRSEVAALARRSSSSS